MSSISDLFARGSLYHSRQEYDRAFKEFKNANDTHRKSYEYDVKEESEIVKWMEAAFYPLLKSANFSLGSPDDTPIFIVGLPRSGTTLVEQILYSHPLVSTAGETQALPDVAARYALEKQMNFFYAVGHMSVSDRLKMADDYIHVLKSGFNSPNVVDKMNDNYKYVGLICLLFKNPKIIHVTRDPLDTCMSMYRTYFTSPHRYAYNLSELGKYYRSYKKLMKFWEEMLPKRMHTVRYEDLVNEFGSEVRKLCNYCQLPWDDEMYRFHEYKREINTASAEQVLRPIYDTSINGWHYYSKHLKPLHDALNK